MEETLFRDTIEKEDVSSDQAAQDLLDGKPVTIYHILHNESDFNSIKENGFQGAYSIKNDGKQLLDEKGDPVTVTYFLLSLEGLDFGRNPRNLIVKINLNQPGEDAVRISDSRSKGKPDGLLEYNQGFRGAIRRSGVFTPLIQKQELALYGKDWGKKIEWLDDKS